jgi:hypothetical protein
MKCHFKSDDSVGSLGASFEVEAGDVIALGDITRDIQKNIVRNYQGKKGLMDIFSLGDGIQSQEIDPMTIIAFDDGRLPQGFQDLKVSDVLQWGASLFELDDDYKKDLEEGFSKAGKSGVLSLDYFEVSKSEKAFCWLTLFSLKFPYIVFSYDLYGMGFNEFKAMLLPLKNVAVRQGVTFFLLMNKVKGLESNGASQNDKTQEKKKKQKDQRLPVKVVEVKRSGRS